MRCFFTLTILLYSAMTLFKRSRKGIGLPVEDLRSKSIAALISARIATGDGDTFSLVTYPSS